MFAKELVPFSFGIMPLHYSLTMTTELNLQRLMLGYFNDPALYLKNHRQPLFLVKQKQCLPCKSGNDSQKFSSFET